MADLPPEEPTSPVRPVTDALIESIRRSLQTHVSTVERMLALLEAALAKERAPKEEEGDA